MTCQLSVNVNKIATLRNSRGHLDPKPVDFAALALEAGAAGITVHPRPDERHITPSDVTEIADLLAQPQWKQLGKEFNIEGNPFEGDFIHHCLNTKPDQATLVPDDPNQITSNHGWQLTGPTGQANVERLRPVIQQLQQEAGCRVSLFMDPTISEIELVPETGADRIELYTESYAVAYAKGDPQRQVVFEQFAAAAERAEALGLKLNAGHDLNLDNLAMFNTIPNLLEVSIGHALVIDGLKMGWTQAVKAYLAELAN